MTDTSSSPVSIRVPLDRLWPVGLGMWQRPAEEGENCTCGRPAVLVYITAEHGEVGYCGIPDGGANAEREDLDV
jgi:hypothetical protein